MFELLNGYAAIAKTRAIYGKMLKESQYLNLLAQENIAHVTQYLKNNTSYKGILKNVNELTVHRNQLENLLRRQAFENYAKICHYLNFDEDEIFRAIIEEFEMIEILRLIRLLKAKVPNEYITSLPGYLISKCNVDLLKLAEVRKYDELLDLLKNSHYEEALLKNKPKDETSNLDYVSCEHDLYEQFFLRFFNLVNLKTKKVEKAELKHLFGLRVDFLNICTIYRERALFKSEAKKIGRRVFPFCRQLTPEKVEKLITLKDSEKINEILKAFSIEISNDPEKNKNFQIEKHLSQINYKICKKYLRTSRNISTVFYAFHVISQIEISNLIYIIEGIRYKVSADEIKKLLII